MKLLVTGGAGFIGSHLVRKLLADGQKVTVLDNVSTGDWSNLPAGCDRWEMDIRSEEARERIIAAGFDAMVHLAGQTMVNVSIDDPLFDATENVVGTVNLLEAARKGGIRRIVFASTAAAYGDVPENALPIREERLPAPMSFYGLTKVTVERYLKLYQEQFGLDYVVLRFANVYGERQGDRGEGGVISIFARKVAGGGALSVYGDGHQTRDFIYAGDIAAGICAALTIPAANTVYNLSTQTETSLLDLIQIFGRITGRKIETNFCPARAGDICRSVLCNEKARQALKWQPVTSLEQGLKNTLGYIEADQRGLQ